MMKPQNTYPAASTIIDNARRLASDGQNTEYDRALVELTAVLTGMESFLAENHEVVDRIVLGRPVLGVDATPEKV